MIDIRFVSLLTDPCASKPCKKNEKFKNACVWGDKEDSYYCMLEISFLSLDISRTSGETIQNIILGNTPRLPHEKFNYFNVGSVNLEDNSIKYFVLACFEGF